MNEKIQAFHLALKLADISITLQMSELIYLLKEKSDEKSLDLSIKDITEVFDIINKKYPQNDN
jgi:hypothetical protein